MIKSIFSPQSGYVSVLGTKYTVMAIKKDRRDAQETKEAILEIRDALNERIENQNQNGENIPGKINISEDNLLGFFNPDLPENWPI